MLILVETEDKQGNRVWAVVQYVAYYKPNHSIIIEKLDGEQEEIKLTNQSEGPDRVIRATITGPNGDNLGIYGAKD